MEEMPAVGICCLTDLCVGCENLPHWRLEGLWRMSAGTVYLFLLVMSAKSKAKCN